MLQHRQKIAEHDTVAVSIHVHPLNSEFGLQVPICIGQAFIQIQKLGALFLGKLLNPFAGRCDPFVGTMTEYFLQVGNICDIRVYRVIG